MNPVLDSRRPTHTASPAPADRRWWSAPSIAAACLALYALTGCVVCPDIGYVDGFTLQLDQAPPPDADWQLVVTLPSEPPCTIELTPDAARFVPEGACRWPHDTPWIDRSAGYGVLISGFTPAEVHVILRIDGADVVERTVEPRYETRTPDGPYCGGSTNGEAWIEVPAADG